MVVDEDSSDRFPICLLLRYLVYLRNKRGKVSWKSCCALNNWVVKIKKNVCREVLQIESAEQQEVIRIVLSFIELDKQRENPSSKDSRRKYTQVQYQQSSKFFINMNNLHFNPVWTWSSYEVCTIASSQKSKWNPRILEETVTNISYKRKKEKNYIFLNARWKNNFFSLLRCCLL